MNVVTLLLYLWGLSVISMTRTHSICCRWDFQEAEGVVQCPELFRGSNPSPSIVSCPVCERNAAPLRHRRRRPPSSLTCRDGRRLDSDSSRQDQHPHQRITQRPLQTRGAVTTFTFIWDSRRTGKKKENKSRTKDRILQSFILHAHVGHSALAVEALELFLTLKHHIWQKIVWYSFGFFPAGVTPTDKPVKYIM